MASTSFSFSSPFSSALSPPPPPHFRVSFRVSAGYATPETCSRTTSSFYDVLGVQSGASCQEIKSAYRKLARVLHPDVCGAAEDFMQVHAAYATLSDPERRAMYDTSLFRRRRRTVLSGGYSELTRRGRSWETDQCW